MAPKFARGRENAFAAFANATKDPTKPKSYRDRFANVRISTATAIRLDKV